MTLDPSTCRPVAHLIHSRVLAAWLVVYQPCGPRLGSHEAMRWYVRPLDDDALPPRSRPFGTVAEAETAIRDGSWDLVLSIADARPVSRRPCP